MHNNNSKNGNQENFSQLEIPAMTKLYELYQLTHSLIMRFPKHERYSLGEKLECTILEAMEYIVFGNAQSKNFKDGFIIKANAKVELLKILFRLALNIGAIDAKGYLRTQEMVQETGKMLGGWIKYLKSN